MTADNRARPRRGCAPPRRRHSGAAEAALLRLREALRADLFAAEQDDGASLAAETDEPDAEAEDTLPAAPRQDEAADLLPEYTAYRDEGCRIAPACLRCPLPACIHDREAAPDIRARRTRDQQIRTLAKHGWSTSRLAARFALSPAQVRRIRVARPPREQGTGNREQ